MIQMSEFTIHGSRKPLETYNDAEEFLVKLIIPGACKTHFRERLIFFGISESYLFPDLEHLAKAVQALEFGIS